MQEITCNIHIHSTYSDGHGTYSTIIKAAAQSNLDVIIVTDHNVWVNGFEGYHEVGNKRILVLTGEEVHNQDRIPQKNHLLALGAEEEMATHATDPQELIDLINKKGGLSFLAHPDEIALKLVGEQDITWVDWDVTRYTGFELWNNFSEIKNVSTSAFQLLLNVFAPQRIATNPPQATLDRWDHWLSQGKHLTVIGGSDAHASPYHLAWMTKIVLPYQYHFSAINNHLLLPQPLNGEFSHDKNMVYQALRKGSSYIGYDLPASTRGFTFTISDENQVASMGDTITLPRGGTAQVSLPRPAELRFIKNGTVIYHSTGNNHLAFPLVEVGAYRVECYTDYLGKKRGWIYSNPIYVV